MTHVDLFSGIGGFALAAQWAGFRTVAFCEIDPYCQEILKQNFGIVADGQSTGCETCVSNGMGVEQSEAYQTATLAHCYSPRLYGDIRSFPATQYREATLLTGGFPCQPFSQAGKRRGKEDDRYLWPEMLRVISEARPRWVLGENVAGIVTMELDRVLSDLEGEGYAVQALIIPACAVDAKHRRDRVWIVAHSARDEQGRSQQRTERKRVGQCGKSLNVPHPKHTRLEIGKGDETKRRSHIEFARGNRKSVQQKILYDTRLRRRQGQGNEIIGESEQARWLPEPDVGRVAHGVPFRVDRLKGLGNAIVPQIAYEIIAKIGEIENGKASS